jgi:glutamate carboxypeptidase
MASLSSDERAVVERVGGEPMLDQVLEWSAVNSGSRNLVGLERIAGLLADAFSALRGDVALVPPAKVEIVDTSGKTAEVEHGKHLHLTVRPNAPVQLLLTGHMDTVYGVEHEFQETRWIEDGVLNGPGVADMKGGLAVMLAALKAVEHSALAERIGYEVVIDSDEEVGSPSSAALLTAAAQGKRAALTYEPAALPDGTLAAARPGSGNFSFVVRGRSAHAGRNPEEGRNAIVAASELALRLAMSKTPGLSVNPAKIDGGGPNNIVPDHAILRLNMRPATPADEARARSRFEAAVAAVAAEHDVRIQIHGAFSRPPKPIGPDAERLFGLVAACGADLGLPIAWKPTGGVCDGNNIAACGVPVVDTMGVRGGAIHSSDEFLIVPSLVERARLSTLVLLRIAEGGPS